MKKITILFAALIIGIAAFAQKQEIGKIKFSQDAAKSGWFTYYSDGGSGYVGLSLWEPDEKLAIRYTPAQMATMFDANPKLTKVEIGCWDGAQVGAAYSAYNGKNFTLEVYQGGSYDAGTGEYTPGTMVYTQNYVAAAYAFSEIVLTTPVNIDVNQELMVAIKVNAKTMYVNSYVAVPSASTFGNLAYDPSESAWFDIEFYADQSQTTTVVKPWSIKLFVEDEAIYVENSDLYTMFLAGLTPPYSAINSITIEATDDLVLYPVLGNNGPDAASGNVTIVLSIDGTDVVNQTIPLELESGYFTTLSQDGSFTITAQDLTDLNLSGTFNVCLTATYSGVDNVPGNNTSCLAVTRNTVGINSNNIANVSIYPNPANNVVTVANAENSNISIMDITGKTLVNINNASANQTIDISSLSQGTYLINIDGKVSKLNIVK